MPLAFVAALLAADLPPAPLPPSGKWIVDYEIDMCVASRAFGTEPVLFAIQPGVDMTSSSASLFVVMPGTGDRSVRHGTARIVLAPSGKTLTVDYVSAGLKNGQRGFRFETGEAEMKDIDSATMIGFTAGRQSFALAIGKLQGVRSALVACNENLLKSWGVDPAARAIPTGSLGTFFGPDAYPVTALREGAQGRAVLALTVSPDGKPSACRIVVSAKNQALDDATCHQGMRVRFERSPDGKPTYTAFGVRWLLPN